MYTKLVEESDTHAEVRGWVTGVPVEPKAIGQLTALAEMKAQLAGPICSMPDMHVGKGCVIGTVLATRNVVFPAAVGVDIGCGMTAMCMGIQVDQLPELQRLYHNIYERKAVPVGFDHWNGNNVPPTMVVAYWNSMLNQGFSWLHHTVPEIAQKDRATSQLGTLGGGNHFIEICADEMGRAWVMLHSGSRGIGNAIGNYFITKAFERATQLGLKISHKDLAYLEEGWEDYENYVLAVEWAQLYAAKNRTCMMHQVMEAIMASYDNGMAPELKSEQYVSCHHNYISREIHNGENLIITRKGAVRAREGEMVIIPGSMATHSFIARGLGNPDSFTSCSHGAGRKMSRAKGRKTVTLDEHLKDTQGIVCRRDEGVLDEVKANYKNLDDVMEAQKDLVIPVHKLKQLIVVKG